MLKPLRAYISSTYSDLYKSREVAYDTLRKLGYDAIAMEDYVATDIRPLEKVRADVRNCDLYIGIIGFRYGYIEKSRGISITQCEYEEAVIANIPKLIFLLSPAAPMGKKNNDEDNSSVLNLRKFLSENNLVSFFENAPQLGLLLSIAIRKWEIDTNKRNPIQTLAELKFPKELRIKNYIPEKLLSLKTSIPKIPLTILIVFMSFWLLFVLIATINSFVGGISNHNFSVGNFVPLLLLGFGIYTVQKGFRIDFNLSNGKTTIYQIGAIGWEAANPNAFKIKINQQKNKFQSVLSYGYHKLATSTWFESKKEAIDNFYPFTLALQSELGLYQIKIED